MLQLALFVQDGLAKKYGDGQVHIISLAPKKTGTNLGFCSTAPPPDSTCPAESASTLASATISPARASAILSSRWPNGRSRLPMRWPPSQLSSMKRSKDDWSVKLWST